MNFNVQVDYEKLSNNFLQCKLYFIYYYLFLTILIKRALYIVYGNLSDLWYKIYFKSVHILPCKQYMHQYVFSLRISFFLN